MISSLAVFLGQSQSQVLQELVNREVNFWGEVCGVVHGQNHHDVVGQNLRQKNVYIKPQPFISKVKPPKMRIR